MADPSKPVGLPNLVTILAVLAVAAVLAALLVPHLIKARAQGRMAGRRCTSNLHNIGTSLEMYRRDNEGQYPLQLKVLVPNYLREITPCPNSNVEYTFIREATAFTLVCCGGPHKSEGITSPNYPQYSSQAGLIGP